MKTVYVTTIEKVTLVRSIVHKCVVPDDFDTNDLLGAMNYVEEEIEVDSSDDEVEHISIEHATEDEIGAFEVIQR